MARSVPQHPYHPVPFQLHYNIWSKLIHIFSAPKKGTVHLMVFEALIIANPAMWAKSVDQHLVLVS